MALNRFPTFNIPICNVGVYQASKLFPQRMGHSVDFGDPNFRVPHIMPAVQWFLHKLTRFMPTTSISLSACVVPVLEIMKPLVKGPPFHDGPCLFMVYFSNNLIPSSATHFTILSLYQGLTRIVANRNYSSPATEATFKNEMVSTVLLPMQESGSLGGSKQL